MLQQDRFAGCRTTYHRDRCCHHYQYRLNKVCWSLPVGTTVNFYGMRVPRSALRATAGHLELKCRTVISVKSHGHVNAAAVKTTLSTLLVIGKFYVK